MLDLQRGRGPPLAELTWSDQLPLSDRYALIVPDRRGYGRSHPGARPDFERDGADIVDLLGEGAHLVGFSYGAIGALMAAAQRPDLVWSLTVIEPVAFGLAAESKAVDELVRRLREVYELAPSLSPEEFDARFDRALGFEATAEPVDDVTHGRLDAARRERPPWEARPSLPAISDGDFPKLVISGAWHPAFDAVCDKIQTEIGAHRRVLPGGHGAQHRPEANQELTDIWGKASGVRG